MAAHGSLTMPKRRWLQFRLRTLLVSVVLISLAMSWLALQLKRLAEEQRDIRLILQAGGAVDFETTPHRPSELAYWLGSPPYWLRRLCGKEEVSFVQLALLDPTIEDVRALPNIAAERFCVRLSGTVDDPRLKELARLDRVTYLYIAAYDTARRHRPPMVTDAGISHLAELERLEELSIKGRARITDTGFRHIALIETLRQLGLHDVRISQSGLKHLRGLPHLETLSIQCDQIGDQGLAHLGQMTNLIHSLELRTEGRITDAGLAHLEQLPRLQGGLRLRCRNAHITNEAVDRLQRANPNCRVTDLK
jgi:hypothetical protein